MLLHQPNHGKPITLRWTAIGIATPVCVYDIHYNNACTLAQVYNIHYNYCYTVYIQFGKEKLQKSCTDVMH